MNDFPHTVQLSQSEKQLNFLFDLADRQGPDAEALCSIHYRKEIGEMTASEASTLMDLLKA